MAKTTQKRAQTAFDYLLNNNKCQAKSKIP